MRLEAEAGVDRDGCVIVCNHIQRHIPAALCKEVRDERRGDRAGVALAARIGASEDIAQHGDIVGAGEDMCAPGGNEPVPGADAIEEATGE